MLQWHGRSQEAGEAEIQDLKRSVQDGEAFAEDLNQEIQAVNADVKGLQTEKDLQSGGEVKELSDEADALSKRYACVPNQWKWCPHSAASLSFRLGCQICSTQLRVLEPECNWRHITQQSFASVKG